MENWDEVRTAFQVARMGTVSGAAEVLGVHHATVIRHIDALERRIGVKLFQRHARGYTPTEAGEDLLRVAQATEDQFNQLAGRLRGQGDDVSGELVVTSLSFLAPLLTPALAAFQMQHPALTVRYLTGERLFRLEYGEAHVAIRVGAAPEQPDNVVQPLWSVRVGLFASRDYIDRHGRPGVAGPWTGQRFVGLDDDASRAPFARWMQASIPRDIVTFRCSDTAALQAAVSSGAGIGFIPEFEAAGQPDLVRICDPQPDWEIPVWLVTHVDLHRTTKVQSFSGFLKHRAKDWAE